MPRAKKQIDPRKRILLAAEHITAAVRALSMENGKLREALSELLLAVDSTGGLLALRGRGYMVPKADPAWPALAAAYMAACAATGRRPKIRTVASLPGKE